MGAPSDAGVLAVAARDRRVQLILVAAVTTSLAFFLFYPRIYASDIPISVQNLTNGEVSGTVRVIAASDGNDVAEVPFTLGPLGAVALPTTHCLAIDQGYVVLVKLADGRSAAMALDCHPWAVTIKISVDEIKIDPPHP